MIGSCNDSLLFPWAIQDMAADIEHLPLDLDGYFGLAIVMEREIVLSKRPVSPGFRLVPVLSDMHTNLFMVGHESGNTVGFSGARTLPARYRGWIFGLSGDVPDELENPDSKLLETVPDFLKPLSQSNFNGSSIFAWALSTLYRNGLLDIKASLKNRCLHALSNGMTQLRERTGMQALPFTFAISNREYALGFAGESGLHQLTQTGLVRRRDDLSNQAREDHQEHIRSILLASTPEALPAPWTSLGANQCFVISAEATLDTIPA
ncbi:MAG: hypothetical protein CMH54_12730 [Myxococcales bacterium]|nr:hypothetical protein [Myxococcales bacterium]